MTETRTHSLKTRIIAIALLLCIALEPGLTGYARGFLEYVSSLKLFIADTVEEAISDCNADGYIPFEMDLNDEATGGAVVMGYTKTTDIKEAITDISVLEMNSGYRMLKYQEIAEKQLENLSYITNDLIYSVYEFQDNLNLGSPAAREALEILNLYYIPEKDDIGLGDYLADADNPTTYLQKIIMRASSAVTYALYTALSSGVSDFEVDEEGNAVNWITRTISSEARTNLKNETEYEAMDRAYLEQAIKLRDVITDFYTEYSDAKAYVDENGYDAFGLDEESAAEDTSYELSEETIEKITDEEKEVEENDQALIYIMAYEMLNSYEWSEDMRFGDYILSLGEETYSTNEDLRILYPLLEGLSLGQYGVVIITGLAQLVLSISNNDEVEARGSDYVESIRDDIGEATGERTLSVWSGVDLTIYEEEVALTSEAQRQLDAKNSYNELTKADEFDETLNLLMTKVGIATSVVSLMYLVTAIGAAIPTFLSEGFLAGVSTAVTGNIFNICFSAVMRVTGSIFVKILGFLGAVATIVMYVVLGAMILILLVKLIDWFIGLFTSEREKTRQDYTWEDIPGKVYDYEDGNYIRYDVVEDQEGRRGDLNAYDGLRFTALYTTTDPTAGDPITVSDAVDTFVLRYNNPSAPKGYLPVSAIGGTTALNLNDNANFDDIDFEDADRIYLFYNGAGAEDYVSEEVTEQEQEAGESSGEQEESPGTSEEQEPPEETDDGQEPGEEQESDGEQEQEQDPEEKTHGIELASTDEYLQSLELSTASTGKAAKAYLTSRGYTVIDFDLTPSAEDSHTYLGYKTTKNTEDAIRDIRVSPKTDGSVIEFGQARYVLAGEVSGGTTQGGLGIYYSIMESSGTPIYANLLVTDNREDAPAGWEPVNLFCGGEAYNINDCSDEDELVLDYDCTATQVYIFFEPTEKYTEGTEYLGGFTAINAQDPASEEKSIYDVADYYGFTILSEGDLSAGMELSFHGGGSWEYEQAVYLAYSVTYNPYRAIYDIKSYTAAPYTTSLNLSMGSYTTGAYAAVDTLYRIYHTRTQVIGNGRWGQATKPWYRDSFYGASNNHSYLIMGSYLVGYANMVGQESLEQAADDFMEVSWDLSEEPLLKGLYVEGPVEDKEPLTPDDLVLTSDYSDEKNEEMLSMGFVSVQDFRTPNRTEAHNIAYSPESPQVLYIRKDVPEAGKYISSIQVVSWDPESILGEDYSSYSESQLEEFNKLADNTCIVNLTAQVNGEILPLNLAVEKEETWQADWENQPEQVAYIGVSRTDNSKEAITSIIKFAPDDPSEAKSSISVNGVSYTKACNEAIHAASGDYYIYYSKSGGNPGEPITDISFDDTPIIKYAATALTANSADERVETEQNGRRKYQTIYASLEGKAEEVNYIHSAYETKKTYIDSLYVASGDTENEALAELLSLGCNMIVPIDMNQNAGGKYVYLGYTRFYVGRGSFLKESDAICDIICTVGQEAEESIEYKGVTYVRAWDRYNWNEQEGAVSLNDGTSGRQIYIYYTSDTFNTALSPIMSIGAHTRDFIPDNEGEYKWESVLASDATRCNLNDGVFGTGEDGHSLDNRIYLFVNRKDNSVKVGGNIADGNKKSLLKYGQLSFME